MDGFKAWWNNPDRRMQMSGIGMALSQLSAGAPVNISPAIQMLEERRGERAERERLQAMIEGVGFNPEQQTMLAQLPAPVATQLIAEKMFPAAPAPVKGVEINGQLVDPFTGAIMGDFRNEEALIQPLSAEEVASLGLDPSKAYQRAPDGRITQIGGAGTNVTTNVNTGSEVGSIPPGFELFTDPVTGARSMRPIAGGPEDTSKQDALREEGELNTATLQLEEIERAKALLAENPNSVTGFFGNILRNFAGSDAANFQALADTIGANISFDYLNAMRQASPTGGALGNVTERELELLRATAGSLSQVQSADQLMANLERLEGQMLEVIHGKGNVPAETSTFDFGAMSRDELLNFDTSNIKTAEQGAAYKEALNR